MGKSKRSGGALVVFRNCRPRQDFRLSCFTQPEEVESFGRSVLLSMYPGELHKAGLGRGIFVRS